MALKFDLEFIENLIKIIKENDLHDMHLQDGQKKIQITSSPPPQQNTMIPLATNPTPLPQNQSQQSITQNTTPSINQNITQNTADDHLHHITSPMVGVVYLAEEPGAPPFVKKGQQVQKGQTLLLVEAMKTFNPVKSSINGCIKDILIKNTDPVEFNQTLILIEPS